MTTRLILSVAILAAIASLAACKDIDCGDGTIEKDGECVPADETVGNATCGPNTVLQGSVCVPNVQCDPSTTTPMTDPDTGEITCVGTSGGLGCDQALPCPAPSDNNHQTVCGQIYNLEDDTKFAAADAKGVRCSSITADGPCALGFKAFDAVTFAMNPSGTTPQQIGDNYIDDCGRYRLENIATPGSPYLGLGLDDANSSLAGPAGVTNTMGTGTLTAGGSATKDFDAFVAKKSFTDMWAAGGVSVSAGPIVNIFRAHQTGEAEAPGVTFTRNGNPAPNDDYYFGANATTRDSIDGTASTTGKNGTVIVLNAKLSDGAVNSGTGGIDSTCVWDSHPAASLSMIVFVQVKHPMDNFSGDTCDL
jgi:hypothetical protein